MSTEKKYKKIYNIQDGKIIKKDTNDTLPIKEKRFKRKIKIFNSDKDMTERYCQAILKNGDSIGDKCGKITGSSSHLCPTHKKEKIDANLSTGENTKPITDEDMIILPNKFKNFVYPGTKFILDTDNKVVAKEGLDGSWLPLTGSDIKEVKRLHLRYKIKDFRFKGETAPKDLSIF